MREGVAAVVGSKESESPSLWQGQSTMPNGNTLLLTFVARTLLLVAHPISSPLFKLCSAAPTVCGVHGGG